MASSASALVAALTENRPETTSFEIPHYDRKTGCPQANLEQVEIAPDSVVILEGVAACRIPNLVENASPFLWMACDGDVRRQRFLRDYKWRGIPDASAIERWDRRLRDEVLIPPQGSKIINPIRTQKH
jgi:uridine kinase